MTHTFPGTAVNDMRFCPFDDVLGVGHGSGFTSLIIPGAGEANFDSLEADPFEGKRRRREREVNSLLDKIPFDMITLDTEMVGKLDANVMKAEERINPDKPGYKATPYAQKTRLDRLKADGEHQEDEEEDSGDDEDEDEERRKAKKQARVEKADAKNRARGRNSTLKKMLRKRRRNVVDPQTVSSLVSSLIAGFGADPFHSFSPPLLLGRPQGEARPSTCSHQDRQAKCTGAEVGRLGHRGSSGSFRFQVGEGCSEMAVDEMYGVLQECRSAVLGCCTWVLSAASKRIRELDSPTSSPCLSPLPVACSQGQFDIEGKLRHSFVTSAPSRYPTKLERPSIHLQLSRSSEGQLRRCEQGEMAHHLP